MTTTRCDVLLLAGAKSKNMADADALHRLHIRSRHLSVFG